MRKCRFCRKEIDDVATTCPHCGQDLFPGRTPAAAAVTTETALTSEPAGPEPVWVQRVSVVDIDLPFASMVGFMVKWAIAAIPALVILMALAAIAAIVFGVLFR